MIARQFAGQTRSFKGQRFWARGYAVSTVGLDERDNYFDQADLSL